MVNFRLIAFAVFFHAVAASPLFILSSAPKINGRQDTAATSTGIATPSITATFNNDVSLPDSARLGSPDAECEDAVEGFCG